MPAICWVRGVIALVALCTTTIACGAEKTESVTVAPVASTATESTASPVTTAGSPPLPISTAGAAAGTITGDLSTLDEGAAREFADDMSLLTTLCRNGSQAGDAAVDDVEAAANTVIRVARKYPNAISKDALGVRSLSDALIDVGEQVGRCYPDVGKRLTSSGKRLNR